MKRNVIIGLVALVVVVGGLAFVFSRQADAPESSAQESSQTQTEDASEQSSSTQQESDGITKEEVAKHDSKEDCWTIISGSVYDITSYIPRHPGGDAILQACGTDGTSLFTQRQTSDGEQVGSGSPHSASAQSQLEQFKVGDLAQ